MLQDIHFFNYKGIKLKSNLTALIVIAGEIVTRMEKS